MPITFLDEEEDITPLAPPTKRKITFLDEEETEIAPTTPQAAQPSPYKYDPARFRPRGLVAQKAEQEIGTLEGIANAARNAFDSSRQALDIVGDVTPEEAKNIAKIEFDKQSRKVAPGYDEYQKAEGFDAVLAFAKNPIEVTSNIVAEGLAGSLPALGAGLAAGGVGAAAGSVVPVLGTGVGFTAGQVAGTFAGSLATEYGSKILEEMQNEGVDLTKPESIQGFFENEEAVAKARDKAISRGIPVAAFDAISAGIGGKLGRVIGKQFLTKTGEAAAELGVQAGLGGGGEVAGALVAGEPIEGKAVFGEVIGEAGPGAAEIITGRMADRAARVKAEEEKKIKAAAQLSDNLEQNNAPLTAAAVKSTTATTIEQDKLAAQLEEQLDADEIASQVSGQLAVTKEPTAAPPAIKSKEEFAAIYSQVAPEELDAAEAGFTNTLAAAATEEARANAQNALEAIKEVKATVTPPAPTVEPTIIPAVTPAVPTAQPPITDATKEIIQPEGVRQEPQDRVEVRPTEEAGVGDSLLGATRGQEEGQVAPTAQPIISEIPPTSELVGAEPTQPTIREVPEISPIVGAEPAAIVEQEPVAPAEEASARKLITQENLPDYARMAVMDTGAEIRTNIGGSLSAPDPFEGSSWEKVNIPISEVEATPKTFIPRGSVTKGPIVIDASGKVIDGNNRLYEARQRGEKTIEAFVQRSIPAKAVDAYNITLPKGYTKQGELYVYQPAATAPVTTPPVTKAVTPVTEAAPTPAGISVGNRIKLGKSPQTYTIEEVIPQSATERELGEQYYSVKNERTGETQVVEARDLKQVKGKGARKLFAGERAEIPQFMRDSLDAARAMAAAGKTTEEIRAVTGWFPGMDGKMRWEIPDQDARIVTPQTKNRLQRATEWLHSQGVPMNLDVGSPKVDQELRKKSLEYADQNIPQFNLSDILQHESLYAAYPEARNIPIKFQTSTEYAGMYEPASGVISIGEGVITDKSDAKLSTLLHEIQHWIQNKEGFAAGTNLRTEASKLKADKRVTDAQYELQKAWAAVPPLERVDVKNQLRDSYGSGNLSTLGLDKNDESSLEKLDLWEVARTGYLLEPNVEKALRNLFEVRDAVYAGSEKDSARQAYLRNAGEIESRDVEARRTLSPEQRKAVAPYTSQNIATEDAIIIQESEGAASEVSPTPEGILITPPDQQYTFNEVFDVAYDMFGGEIPEGFTIVNDSKDKDFEFKAAYIPESGEIIVNLAYLNKNDDIRDAITHELGHYIYGDPEFRAAFDQFIASLSPEARAELDAYVDTAYNKETGEIRLEEKMVRAFVDQFINEENAPAWRSMLDAIKRFLNKLGFKFNISDRGAISVFTAALDRYKAGEAISREGGARLMVAEPAPKRRKEQVGGAEREETRYITTPKGILSMNTDVLREKFFDGTSVSPEKTTQAWGYISRLLDIKSGNANEFAGEINDTVVAELEARREAAIAAGEKVDPEEDVSKRIGAAMFSVELMNYAGRLAEQGDTRMLKFMIRNVNSMPTDEYAGDISNAARALRTRLEYDVSGFGAYNADQKGKVDRTAAIMFSTDKPSKEQFDAVNDALSDAEKTELGSPEEVAGDIENVEKRTGRSVVKKIEEKIKASTAPKKEELLISFQNLNQDRKFAGINITYKPQKIDPAKNIQNLIIGKLVDYRKTLVNQGADGLESTFWQTMSSKERKPGPLGELDQAQNNELAKIVQKTLIDLGLKGKPPNTKMTDIEKVAAILNEQRLGEEKKVAADKKIVEEIERRRSSELEGGGDSDAVNAKYDAILNAWNEAMSRQTNMPISDNMLQRLINSELKEQGSSVTELINEPYEDVLSQKKKGIVDSIIRRIYGVSKEAETGIEISEDYDNLSRYLKQTLENMLKLQAEKRDAAVARTLQRGLGDLPAIPEAQKNKSQSIVQQDLRQQPDMGRREPWKNMLVGKLTQAGVAPEQAENIANLVWRQHEINDANRKIKEMKTAAEKGSLAVIIDRIKNTSLERQQSPEWKQEVIKEYLRDAGLSSQAAETAAKLYDSVISERIAAAKQKAFEDTLAKAAPWKNYASRNGKLAKDALKKIKEAIRTGVLDPEKNTESIIAALSGWTGFTKEQYQRIVELDTILNDPNQDDVTKREAMDALNKIITKAKMPVNARQAIGAYYVGQALGGIPTATVNVSSPTGFSIRNLMVDIAKYAKTDPARIPIAFESFLDSMRSWYNQTAYAFKNQIYLNDVVEYLNGQNVLRELFDKGKQQWAEGKYAEGLKNMAIGMMQITGRVLSALDQGAISMLENQNITRYAMAALENAKHKVPKNKIREFANMTLDLKRRVIAENIAAGMDKNRAVVLADLAVKSEIRAALSEFGISYQEVLDSAVNDALQAVGRNKVITTEGIKKSQQNISDSGFLSYPPIKFLEWISSSAGKEGPAMQIFSKMVYGFAIVPARTFSTAAWFSPYGFLRLAIDKYKTNRGQESPYAMSLQTEAQYRQRLTESIAGSIVMLALFAMRSGSSDDEDDKLLKLVITGNGPNATTDKQYYDSWIKEHKPYSIELHFGDSKATINIGRGGEALFFPIMLAGALDDWEIKKKQNLTKKEPSDLNIATEMLGSAFFALAQRGPYAAFTEPLFDASKQGRVTENLVGQLGYFGKTFIPVLGTSITRNISDFINDPVDRSSIEGALYANTPIVGPWIGTKALNALGQPIRADDFSDKLFKLGVPVVFSFPKNTPENALNELILKQGSGPTLPTRANAQKRFGDVLTDKEFETYVREYGRVMSDKMFKNRTRLANMKAVDYDDELEKYARGYSIDGIKIKGASDSAVLAVKRMRQ